jgi:hypothetical protein
LANSAASQSEANLLELFIGTLYAGGSFADFLDGWHQEFGEGSDDHKQLDQRERRSTASRAH